MKRTLGGLAFELSGNSAETSTSPPGQKGASTKSGTAGVAGGNAATSPKSSVSDGSARVIKSPPAAPQSDFVTNSASNGSNQPLQHRRVDLAKQSSSNSSSGHAIEHVGGESRRRSHQHQVNMHLGKTAELGFANRGENDSDDSNENPEDQNCTMLKLDNTLQDAFNKGNVSYAISVCGLGAALVEYCIRQKRESVRRILELHPEILQSPDPIIPGVGTTFMVTKRVLTQKDYDTACQILASIKREVQIADAFEMRDATKLETLYSGGLKTGIVEACRRNEYNIAKRLCQALYTKTPSYRKTRLGSFSNETVGVQRMLEKLHFDVCQQCEVEENDRRKSRRACVLL